MPRLIRPLTKPRDNRKKYYVQSEKSQVFEDLEVDNMEENVEKCLPETADEQFEHTETEEVDVEAEQVSEGGEEHVTARGTNLPPSPRRNSPRNRRPTKKLSYESQAVGSEEDQPRIERGWKLWQRAKVRKAAGHM